MVRKSLWIGVALALGMLVMVGCSKLPTQEMETANAAVERARKAEVGKYAPQEFRALQDSLTALSAEVDRQKGRLFVLRDYDRAKALAQAVTDLADEVQDVAIENKARLQSQTQELIAKAQTAIEEARSFVERAPTGKGSQMDIKQLEADLAALEVALTEARKAMSREEFTEAQTKAQAVLGSAAELKGEIQVAIDKYAQWRKGRKG